CPDCGKAMQRVSEVIDCWYDSGSMPFAQHHYPFENKELFEKNFPAQFISEAVDQTRGWFYTLLAISTALFGKSSFENCVVLGHVLDKNGLKMSKHKGNVLNPFVILENEGADALRWYFYTASAPWLPSRFYEDAVIEAQRKFLNTLWNVYSFYVLYAQIDRFDPVKHQGRPSSHIMDKWILSKLQTLINKVDDYLDTYKITGAAELIEEFTDELSNWYVRRNRTRYWGTAMTDDKMDAYLTLHTVLRNLVIVSAPFVPFITEEIYQNLVVRLDPSAPDSVHLCQWPAYDEKLVDKQLEAEMELTYQICGLGRSARNLANIKNRQPLAKMLLSTKDLPDYYIDIIKEELNIKEVATSANMAEYVDYTVKPNSQVLGKTHGRLIPGIRTAIAAMDQMDVALKTAAGQSIMIEVDGTLIQLDSSNLLITMNGQEGFTFAGEGEVGVVLDTHITDDLRREGYAREVISKLQNMRKDSFFEVMDKIKIYMAGNPLLEEVVITYKDYIMSETLAVDLVFNQPREYTDVNINGERLKLAVEKL
ncbi:MAG: Isoleucyl-tRNA synthetase, partial [Anaerosporomusa subterranea]|nr:Isoleucyl-tRNA synthetase [Anaerosporomusa subterranea]